MAGGNTTPGKRTGTRGITYYADPGCRQPGQVYSTNGRRGTYFRDPDGHLMEILTPISAEQELREHD